MRIAFMWKWWSGKTTLSSNFIKYLEKQFPESTKLIFDVDINSHLSDELWFISPEPLGVNFENIFQILEPSLVSKFWAGNIPVVWTFPITSKSTLIEPNKIESYGLEKFYSNKGKTYFFQSGNYIDQEVWAHSCYHGMLNTYELFMHHIKDSNSDFIVADTTAWSDNLGTSLYMAYDLSCFIVEPTERSIQVCKDYIKTAKEKNIYVIVNKIRTKDDYDFIKKNIGEEKILCSFWFNKWIYRETENSSDVFIEQEWDNFSLIINKLKSIDKNWDTYYKSVQDLYKKEVNGWFSDFHGIDLEKLYINNK